MPRRPKRTRRPRPANLIAEIPPRGAPPGAAAPQRRRGADRLRAGGGPAQERPARGLGAQLAGELLGGVGGLAGLATACPETLRRDGVAEVKLATLLAAAEIGRRFAAANIPNRSPLKRPGAVAAYLNLRYGRIGQEVVGAIYLDARSRLMAERELFRGTLDRALVEPRAVLRACAPPPPPVGRRPRRRRRRLPSLPHTGYPRRRWINGAVAAGRRGR